MDDDRPLQTCTAAQLTLLVESFISLLVVSAIGGYVVKMFLRPLSRVRFSNTILLNNGRRRVQTDDDAHDAPTGQGEPMCRQSSSGDRATATGGHGEADGARASVLASCRSAMTSCRPVDSPLGGPSQPDQKRYKFLTFRMVRQVRHLPASPSSEHRPSLVVDLASIPHDVLTLRVVHQGRVQLRDVRVQMQAQYWISGATAFGDRDSHKGRVVNLQLEQNYFTTLEQACAVSRPSTPHP